MNSKPLLLIAIIIASCGCLNTLQTINSKLAYPTITTADTNATPTVAKDGYIIGVHNNQRFGINKSGDMQMMEQLVKIYSKYDILALQEIVDVTGTSPRKLDTMLTSQTYIISERVGRTTYKEQYAYYYNPSTVQLIASGTYPDRYDLFEREPFMGYFKIGNKDIIFIQCHTKPEDAEKEIRNLKVVVDYYKTQYPNEEDIIILGDLNADCSYFQDNNMVLKEYTWTVTDNYDTTVGNTICAYDRILISGSLNGILVGNATVDRFDTQLNLTQDQAKEISDHYPVYIRLLKEDN